MSISLCVSSTSEEKEDDSIMASSIFRHSQFDRSSRLKPSVDDRLNIYLDDSVHSLSSTKSTYLINSDRDIPSITRATAIGLTGFENQALVGNVGSIFSSSENEELLLYIEDSIMDRVEDDLPLFTDEAMEAPVTGHIDAILSDVRYNDQSTKGSFDRRHNSEPRESRSVCAELKDTSEVSRTSFKTNDVYDESEKITQGVKSKCLEQEECQPLKGSIHKPYNHQSAYSGGLRWANEKVSATCPQTV
eukprot:CAMPEP_0172514390 /NCGR_PEP_ID=MMETSP1066-20121228/259815_1 /TAXON_ID=671091 /ORGANISM="Coscinodiscus wailesii, Strain CCMP2513" /LENGTH=246 /DNA_ID=CAMNT_0013295041 /DNA_START=163 /DNA_END=903 /DNA_ORIENTATION=-